MPNITMKEIAHQAGVSRQAVSSILNNGSSVLVSPETKERVLAIARKNDYQPNFFARSLKEGRTNIIGLSGTIKIGKQFSNYINGVAEGIEEQINACGSNNTLIMFPNNFANTYEKSIEMARQRVMDGIIFVLLGDHLKTFVKEGYPLLRKNNVPFVVIHSTQAEYPFNNVGLDNIDAGYSVGSHFIEQGYEDIGYYLPHKNSLRYQEPLAGFCKAAAEAGLGEDAVTVLQPKEYKGEDLYGTEIAYRSFKEYKKIPRALFVPDDYIAYEVIRACREQGLSIPADVAVVGFDDINPVNPYVPDISTLWHPFKDKGRRALAMLEGVLDGTLSSDEVHQEILKPTLQVRWSSLSKQQ